MIHLIFLKVQFFQRNFILKIYQSNASVERFSCISRIMWGRSYAHTTYGNGSDQAGIVGIGFQASDGSAFSKTAHAAHHLQPHHSHEIFRKLLGQIRCG